MPEYTKTITQEDYAELLIAQDWMQRLEFGGVDNWDWYSESLRGEFYGAKQTHWDYANEVREKAKKGEL